jgi:hypothetical protein
MATSSTVVCTTAWTLVYDSTVSGSYSGSVQVTGLGYLRVAPSVPAAGLSGIELPVGMQPITLTSGDSDKLYGRANNGTISVLLG